MQLLCEVSSILLKNKFSETKLRKGYLGWTFYFDRMDTLSMHDDIDPVEQNYYLEHIVSILHSYGFSVEKTGKQKQGWYVHFNKLKHINPLPKILPHARW